jgi:hypothetical protein
VREIRTLRAMWRVLETGLRKLLNGHEDGNLGYSQGVSYGLPRQRSTLPRMSFTDLKFAVGSEEKESQLAVE